MKGKNKWFENEKIISQIYKKQSSVEVQEVLCNTYTLQKKLSVVKAAQFIACFSLSQKKFFNLKIHLYEMEIQKKEKFDILAKNNMDWMKDAILEWERINFATFLEQNE